MIWPFPFLYKMSVINTEIKFVLQDTSRMAKYLHVQQIFNWNNDKWRI